MFVRLKFGAHERSSAAAEKTAVKDAPSSLAVVAEPPAIAPRKITPRIKTYRVAEVRQAMSAARRELGDEAILIQTKRLDPPQDDCKYEVTFGIIGDAGSAASVAPINTPFSPQFPAPKRADEPLWADEFSRVRADIAALQAMLSRSQQETDPASAPGHRTIRLRNQLVQHGVDSDLVSEWLTEFEDSLQPGDDQATAAMLAEQLSSRIQVEASLSSPGKAMMLVGPPASGKTTALLKLALEYGIKRGRAVEVWGLDPTGAELDHATQCFTQLLNIPTRTFKSPRPVAVALGKVSLQERLILIDTKRYGSESGDTDRELSMVLSGPAPIDCQLVLSAAWHPLALSRAVDHYEVFNPSRLLFTMIDQACTFGPPLQEPWRTRKPLSFLGEGALGSGKIQPASLAFILDRID